ncbi:MULTISPECIES: hypothetical protein [unclassified Caballeronia]|uniref:hypothetical protein n=1 Tax=unclassified Caballeronia TaxID=2646786 RepID=UPI0020282A18|nr:MULTISPECIES: hypothetical protein [unclassified Caballeronia]
MTVQQILELIQRDANSFSLSASDALPAYTEILSEVAPHVSSDDFITLVAIGSVLLRNAQAESLTQELMTKHIAAAKKSTTTHSSL